MSSRAAPTVYDRVLYPSYTRIQTHPDRLATIGRLLGMNPAPVERCRMLELGCGNGSNLGPIAYGLPESEFVGVDLASLPIANANKMAAELGLRNVTFHNRSITEVGADLGMFDYIVCHGVYSWVPAEVRESILRVCRENLRPNGIAFVSYNAYPGNRLREMIREMMLFHVAPFEEPKDQIAQARALAGFVAAAQNDDDLYRHFLKDEMEMFLRQDGNYVFHDALAEINTPFYFFQFMEAARAHRLQYLGEADFQVMLDVNLPAEVGKKLDELSGDRIAREQYLDFLRCRRFRQTLLCHEDAKIDLALKPAQLAEFFIAGLVRPAEAAAAPAHERVLTQFENRHGARIQTDSPAAKTAFAILTEEWPQALAFPELLERTRASLLQHGWESRDEARERFDLQATLFRSYAVGLIEVHSHAPKIDRRVSERPAATPLARWQAQQANFVTSLFHSSIPIEDGLIKDLLGLLDGTRDREELLAELERRIDARRIAAGSAGQPIAAEADTRRMLREGLEQNLSRLARMGLLAG